MSYILDALKKAQLEQQQDVDGPPVVSATASRPQRSMVLWVVAVALVANAALLGWFLLPATSAVQLDAAADDGSARQRVDVANQTTPPPIATQSAAAKVTQPATQNGAAEQTDNVPAAPNPESPTNITRTEPVRSVTPRPAARVPAPSPRLQRVHARELSARERTLFETFNYTSHIYTEAVDMRAVVVDGQKLATGDEFKGMRVFEITETGVVFEDRRRGRLVEVTPFE
ncbi:MAG: general secretion pathway protein GspB [Pseudomonadota bacterium]